MTALYAIGDFVGTVRPPFELAKPSPKLFYLLRLHPNYDLRAERELNEHDVPVYVPKVTRTISTGWNRKVRRDIALFPGAMFVPDFAADLMRLKNLTAGIGGFVKSDGHALRVSLKWMDIIRRFEAKQQAAAGNRKFTIGQKVRITKGLYELWEAKVERLDPNYRIRVLIDTIKREIPIDLDEGQVEAV